MQTIPRAPAPVSADVVVNGVRLNYLDWGGNGPALVMVPGAASSPHFFDRIAASFVGRYRVVSYARRGDVRSEWKGPYDFDTETEDLHQLLHHLGIDRAHLVGFSLGGSEITRLAGFGPWQAEQRAQFERALPSAEVHLLPSLHHANFLLASPEGIARLMSAFLARADAGVTH